MIVVALPDTCSTTKVILSNIAGLSSMMLWGSFYTTVPDMCRYDRALATNTLISEASMREALTSGQTNCGDRTGYGFGWYLGTYDGMPLADHQGTWIGFYLYICRYLDRPFSIFLLSNHPQINLVEFANVATAAYA